MGCRSRSSSKSESAAPSTDVGFFIADKKGYFRDEGLAVNFTNFDTASKMVAPLGTGQLDIGGGAPSVGLYNAIVRGIDIKIVADKGATPPGHGFQPLMIRSDLIASGRFKTLKDLKGLKIAISGPGTGAASHAERGREKGRPRLQGRQHGLSGFPAAGARPEQQGDRRRFHHRAECDRRREARRRASASWATT